MNLIIAKVIDISGLHNIIDPHSNRGYVCCCDFNGAMHACLIFAFLLISRLNVYRSTATIIYKKLKNIKVIISINWHYNFTLH